MFQELCYIKQAHEASHHLSQKLSSPPKTKFLIACGEKAKAVEMLINQASVN